MIESLYVDKVVKDLGLVVTLYEIVSIERLGTVGPARMAAHFHVVFKVVVFRPFVGEVLEGRVDSTRTAWSLYVRLGFFNDVFIPEHMLQEPSAFDAEAAAVGVELPERAHVHGPQRARAVQVQRRASASARNAKALDERRCSGGRPSSRSRPW